MNALPSKEPVQQAYVFGCPDPVPSALAPSTHFRVPSSAVMRKRSGHSSTPMPSLTKPPASAQEGITSAGVNR